MLNLAQVRQQVAERLLRIWVSSDGFSAVCITKTLNFERPSHERYHRTPDEISRLTSRLYAYMLVRWGSANVFYVVANRAPCFRTNCPRPGAARARWPLRCTG